MLAADSRTDATPDWAYLFGIMVGPPIRERDLRVFFAAFVIALPLALLASAGLILWYTHR